MASDTVFHPDAEAGTIAVGDLLESIVADRVARFTYPPGDAVARRTESGDYILLRVNESAAFLSRRRIKRDQLRVYLTRAVDVNGRIELGEVDELWPSRYGRGGGGDGGE